MTYTVGSYLATRLHQIGLKHHFAVAGDFNLVLLDQLLTVKELEQVYCCNELNCGYSAEGYARACGAAADCWLGLRWFTEGFDTRDLKEAKARLDELHA
jgi:TPP-dependent 2-oxoacid decarboxylase